MVALDTTRCVLPWLLAVLVLVGALLGLVGVALVGFRFGPVSAFWAALGGLSVVWAVLDHPASRRRSS
jgi:hypothetical protein